MLFIHSGCGIFTKGTFSKDETGAYVRHFYSCGPQAIRDVMNEFKEKHQLEYPYYSDAQISREIQESGNLSRFTLAVFDERAMAITWPTELRKYFTKRGFTFTETSFNSLQKNDIAIVLIKKGLSYHWITYPTHTKKYIKNFYGSSTKLIKTYIIKKEPRINTTP